MALNQTAAKTSPRSRVKFIIGGLLIVTAVVYLIFTSTQASAQYFLTVDELSQKSVDVGSREIRVSGAVLGDTIQYDAQNLLLTFEGAHVPADNAEHEAQAIMTGRMNENGGRQGNPVGNRRCLAQHHRSILAGPGRQHDSHVSSL